MSPLRDAGSGYAHFMLLGSVAGTLAFLVHGALAHRPFLPSYEPPRFAEPAVVAPRAPSGPEAAEGQALYVAKCAACHQADGRGLPGAFPPLAGSSWASADPETPIRIALLGLSGPIEVNGKTFDSAMPALGLTDEEVAPIVSYVRSAWGNQAAPVTTAQVTAVRNLLQGRTTPWDAKTLSSLRAGK